MNDTFLFWSVVVFCGAVAVRALRARTRHALPFVFVPLGVVVLSFVAGFVWPGYEGEVSAVLCGAFVLAPMFLSVSASRLATRRRYKPARAVARLAMVLHPSRSFRELPRYIGALEKIHSGVIDDTLLRDTNPATPLGRFVYAQALRSLGRWPELLNYTSSLSPALRATDPHLAFLHVRGLAEAGRVEEMLEEYARLEPLPAMGANRDLLSLVVATWFGRVDLADRLLAGRAMAAVPPFVRQSWRASALQAAGRPEGAEALAELAESPDVDTRRGAARRLAVPLAPIDMHTLSPRARELLAYFERELEAQSGLAHATRTTPVTWVLAASLIVAFLFEIPGGTMDLENLVHLGALVLPPLAPYDDVYRLVSAAWLHFGALHIAMNALGLVAIGRRVEAAEGALRMAVLYLASAVVGNAVAREFLHGPMVLVGASGGVMGTLGALLAITIRRRRAAPTRYIRSVLREILVVIAIQFVFDWVVPSVSSTVHIAGLLTGLVLGLILPARRSP